MAGATQRREELEVTAEALTAADYRVRYLEGEVTRLRLKLIDGNGSSVISRLERLEREVEEMRERREAALKWWGAFALALTGVLLTAIFTHHK